MKKKYDATGAGEKYQNKQGEEKTRYIPVGAVFERPDGSMCMKLESIPVVFNGWINFYEPKYKDAKDAAKNAPKTRQEQKEDFEEEIPF